MKAATLKIGWQEPSKMLTPPIEFEKTKMLEPPATAPKTKKKEGAKP
jgi:hypothetical protein